ncbi:response regulator [Brevibacillus humidisoli]|uniref:response regulator n=1 Tax=Brevibacillus humidisoli TaxID=2895522 RepID=UPI001E5D6755|nr:response regulator [Brevibacillus humidisoli]UFJ41731.1 response regulator [Brevibacillus humidisoli]
MRIILLDDESLALDYLEHQLQKISDVEVVGKYTDPLVGKEHILHEDVDLVFLDIHLPEINGIELAEQILERKPKLYIVFVTAYDDYAIKAFELNALDYLMKPVGTERLLKTMQRIRERAREASDDMTPKKQTLQMNMFHQVSVETDDHLFIPVRWRTTKAQELFLYLLQHRGQLVRKSALIELLWPEYEPSKAFSQLYTAIYHIRKTMEPFSDYIKISNAMDGYILNLENVILDVDVWEEKIQAGPAITTETIGDYEGFESLQWCPHPECF